ncbi:hypothetical protein P171DRAFT_437959 [Karstenula rhodostoma CBS 690.94]|uniref:Uncharacterized protein n=1 Tax=Karstenula rhodostoma CBS 690.94 TaxID=1392251 RepID=A0A9P4PTQ0_9PLEO|nr:hypothetical protein P171DRAFT_437959 [Karstenula rhodostoma CBS 690.94]
MQSRPEDYTHHARKPEVGESRGVYILLRTDQRSRLSFETFIYCNYGRPGVGTMFAKTMKSYLNEHALRLVVDDQWFIAFFRQKTWKRFRNHTDKLLRSVKQPTYFSVKRFSKDMKEFQPVWYQNGQAQGPHSYLNETKGPVDGDVEEWYEKVRGLDVAKAIKSGLHYEKTSIPMGPNAWGRGSRVVRIEEGKQKASDAPFFEAPWLYLFEAQAISPKTDKD